MYRKIKKNRQADTITPQKEGTAVPLLLRSTGNESLPPSSLPLAAPRPKRIELSSGWLIEAWEGKVEEEGTPHYPLSLFQIEGKENKEQERANRCAVGHISQVTS